MIQLVGGLVNVLLAAPVWMQIVHLLLADLSWIALIMLGMDCLAEPVSEHSEELLVSGEQPLPLVD